MNAAPHPPFPDRPPPPSRAYRILMGLMAPVEWVLHVNCRNFMRLASERCDRPLGMGEKLLFHAHRWICGICRHQEKRIRQMRALVRSSVQADDHNHAVRLRDEARARLQERLAQELSGGGDGSAPIQ